MKKILSVFAIVIILMTLNLNVYATMGDYFNGAFNEGLNWGPFGGATDAGGLGGEISKFITGEDGVFGFLKMIGNSIFIIVGVSLGIKFVFASAMDKAAVKQSLITFAVAVCMWGLGSQLVTFFIGNGGTGGIIGEFIGIWKNDSSNGLQTAIDTLTKTFLSVANIAIFIGLILVGVKYMMAPSQDKAKVKEDLTRVVIGLILALCTVNIINWIIAQGEDVLNEDNNSRSGPGREAKSSSNLRDGYEGIRSGSGSSF